MVTAAIITIGILLVIFLLKTGKASTEIHEKFGLSLREYSIVSSDLGGKHKAKRLSGDGVAGIPDALFKSLLKPKMVVGEFKSRKFNGHVKPYELYQTILYMGLAIKQYGVKEVAGVICYADNRVDVVFDQALFDALMGLRLEVFSSYKQKRPANLTPLSKRMNVLAKNTQIKRLREPKA